MSLSLCPSVFFQIKAVVVRTEAWPGRPARTGPVWVGERTKNLSERAEDRRNIAFFGLTEGRSIRIEEARNGHAERPAHPARTRPIPPRAPNKTTTKGGARQAISRMKPDAAMAKSAGVRTALVHTGL